MAITLRILLWAHEGAGDLLSRYEDEVLGIAATHGGEVLSRDPGGGGPADPYEVQVLRFPTEQDLQEFMDDPARQSLGSLRDQAVATTEVIRLDASG